VGQRSGPTLFELAGTGVMSAIFVAAGTGGGYWIASSTGAGAAVTFAGLAVGIAVAVVAAYVKIKRYL
jgi:hypothetical protein